MKTKPLKKPIRREPQQRRARQTVEAVLDAVVRIVKRDGIRAVTTNRVAEVAALNEQHEKDIMQIHSAYKIKSDEEVARQEEVNRKALADAEAAKLQADAELASLAAELGRARQEASSDVNANRISLGAASVRRLNRLRGGGVQQPGS